MAREIDLTQEVEQLGIDSRGGLCYSCDERRKCYFNQEVRAVRTLIIRLFKFDVGFIVYSCRSFRQQRQSQNRVEEKERSKEESLEQ